MPDEKDDRPSKPSTVPIKIEGSVKSPGSLVRLPSFRQPRDLTLGSGSVSRGRGLGLGSNKARKNYAPNLNVQRNKAKEEVKSKEEIPKHRNERGRGRGNRGRGERGRGRGSGNVIQLSSGVFSEGIAASHKPGRGRSDESGSSYVPKPKLDLKQNYSTDSKEENERLRQLLQDDFVDNPDAMTDGIKPLQLPMIPMRKKGAQKSRAVVKKEKDDPDMKADSSLPESESGIKIKKEPGEEEAADFKPLSESEGHIIFERCVGDLLGTREPEHILVQLPDCLPGLKPSVEPEDPKNVNGTPSASGLAGGGNQKPQCTLSTIPEGCIGKIQLMRSGRAYLKLGSVSLPISMGTQVGFKQDLVSVSLDNFEKTGKMINLGQVRTRVVVTPAWETLLGKA